MNFMSENSSFLFHGVPEIINTTMPSGMKSSEKILFSKRWILIDSVSFLQKPSLLILLIKVWREIWIFSSNYTHSQRNTQPSSWVIFVRTISPVDTGDSSGIYTSRKFFVRPTQPSNFPFQEMSISSSLPRSISARFLIDSPRISLRIVHRRVFSSEDISSSYC